MTDSRSQVTSADGTQISVDRQGEGPPLILVDGALSYIGSSINGPLAEAMEHRYTVFTYDRRGRGGSGDANAYAVDREIEDLEAVIALAGGAARVFGISSGAALSLAAAERGAAIDALALFEAPFVVDASREPIPMDFHPRLAEFIAAGDRGGAVRFFMTKGVGLPRPMVAMMRLMPSWRRLKEVAHTLPYDAAILGDNGSGVPLRRDQWASVHAPTLVIAGGKSPAWTRTAMEELAAALPNAKHEVLAGQMHIVKAKALAPMLLEFFANGGGPDGASA